MSKITHTNGVTGKTIKADNLPALDNAMRAERFTEPKWATFWQWKGTGRAVPKGTTGVELVGSSGFKWRVFNVAQTTAEGAEAARAPAPVVTPAPAAPAHKATPPRAGVKTVTHERCAAGAPAVTSEARPRPVVVVDNPDMKRGARPRVYDRSPDAVARRDQRLAGAALPDTAESVANIQRLNKAFNLTEDEARGLIKAYPGRHFFDPEEVASIYGTGRKAMATPQGAHRVAEAKRWRALWTGKCKTSKQLAAKLGAVKTWAWLMFTGRQKEAEEYRKRALARRPDATDAE